MEPSQHLDGSNKWLALDIVEQKELEVNEIKEDLQVVGGGRRR
jgi:hypothetical protein